MEGSMMKSVKMPLYDGSHDKFQIWWTRFLAYAGVLGFALALGKKMETDMPASDATMIDETTDTGKLQAKAKKRNAIAMANLTMLFESAGLMSLVFEATNNLAWPGGLACKVVVALFKKFMPQDTMTRVELRQQLNRVSMKRNENPAVMFEELAAIKNQYNTASKKIKEADLIAVIIDAAPKEYQSVLTNEQLRQGDLITVDNLRNAMNAHWHAIGKSCNSGNDDNELVLNAFDGTCYRCNDTGHKSYQCPQKQGTGGGNGSGGKGKRSFAGKSTFSGKCNNCGKDGHMKKDCWSLAENKDKRPQWLKDKEKKGEHGNAQVGSGPTVVEYLMCTVTEEGELRKEKLSFPNSQKLLSDPDLWIADSAATTHTTPHKMGMIEMKNATEDDAVTVGSGESLAAKKVGNMFDKHGEEIGRGMMTVVTYLPGGAFKLFSITRMIKLGWKLAGDKSKITLQIGVSKIVFDIVIQTKMGMLFCMYFRRRHNEMANATTDNKITKMGIKEAHDKLGHGDEPSTRKAAKELGIEITRGTMYPCDACTIAKAKQKNVPKESESVVAKKGEGCIYLDISTIKKTTDGPNVTKGNWRIMVDERTGLKFSEFYQTKNGMIEPTCKQLYKWQQAGLPVKYIRLDNAGENKALQNRTESSDWKLLIQYEYTARNTPQQNHLAELGFASLMSKGRAMMVAANIPIEL